MGNMIPVCTERDSTCAKRQKFGNQSKDAPKQIVFHADDYFKKRKRKKKQGLANLDAHVINNHFVTN